MTTDETVASKSWTKTKIQDFLNGISEQEKEALADWLDSLLEIRKSAFNRKQKLNQLTVVLKNSRPLLPVVKQLSTETKRIIWTERKGGFRSFLAGSAFAIFLFGFQGAGIAAFGGAIGLPLWVVFGGGSTLAYALLSELRKDEPQ
jgi:hypothetical protein